MRLTTLDFAILGLLLEEPRTGYALRKVFEDTAMGNYSSSPGSIYPAIRKLKAGDMILATTHGNGELLAINDKGKEALRTWLVAPIKSEDIAKRSGVLLLKFAFMDHLVTHAEKLRFMKDFVDLTASYLGELQSYHRQQRSAMPLHGRLALENGILAFQAQLGWARSTLEFFNHSNSFQQ